MKQKSKVVIFALGGNEISPIETDKDTGKMINQDLPAQWNRTSKTCEIIANFIKNNQNYYYIITHGNGPQIGNILLRSEYSSEHLFKLPLDVCGADSQGALGYMIAQLSNSLQIRGLHINTAEIITQVVVDPDDDAFNNPTKFIGPPLTKEYAQSLMRESPNYVAKFYKILDPSKGSNSNSNDGNINEIWRRVVPSPNPTDIIEIDIIEACFLSGNIPIAVGGGGIPVIRVIPQKYNGFETYTCNYDISYTRNISGKETPASIYKGIEGVIDKDLSSSLLAKMIIQRSISRGNPIEVELVILTEIDSVKINYQKPNEESISLISLDEVTSLFKAREFPDGSMGPKILSMINFLNAGGKKAYITNVELLEETFFGKAGTTFIN